ncbi:hypothetical protein O9G_000029 [Rozella allomycis CSF55]|uniref:Uncharacterized protein n=1 Tax=Rozella allomycis (strain CSF55) TaxID=988480 RepID=A0A075ASP6_ROZAC|nr:hypothetical protein O9G_000029 [Rozella allomycis CSF55]|eukprot:EPZ31553.1 hypothetical protein O9G_000029 [Rozella allomycis CSF55]
MHVMSLYIDELSKESVSYFLKVIPMVTKFSKTSMDSVNFSVEKRMAQVKTRERDRNSMGEYIHDPPLSSQGIPLPSPLDYYPVLPPSGKQCTISGRYGKAFYEIGGGSNIGSAKYNVRDIYEKLFKGPSYSFGIKSKSCLDRSNAKNAPKISGKKEERPRNFDKPSPNQYVYQHEFAKDAPKFTFGIKKEEQGNHIFY